MRYLLLLFWLLTAVNLFSQNNDTLRQNNSSRAFSESKWNSIQDRWDKKQPHAQIILHSREKIQGQIIYVNSEKLVIYPGSEIMLKPSQFSDTIQIPMGRIETILLAKTKKETTLPVFRAFSGHPCNILTIKDSFVFLGVPKLSLCLSAKRKMHLEVLASR